MALNEIIVLIDKIRSIIKRIKAKENIKDWAHDLYELSKVLYSNPILQPAIQKIRDDHAQEMMEYTNEVQDIAQIIQDTRQKLIQYLTTNEAALERVSHELPILNATGILSYNHIILQLLALKRIFTILYAQDTSTHYFIQQFASFSDPQKIMLLFIDENSLFDNASNVHRLGNTNVANDLQLILDFRIIYDQRLYKKKRAELEKSGNGRDLRNLNLTYQALDNAINPGKHNTPYQNSFDAYKYKDCAERIFEEIICYFAAEEQKTATIGSKSGNHTDINITAIATISDDASDALKQPVIWYDKPRKILHVKGFKITFRRKGKGYSILSIITQDIASLTKVWHWDEMFEALECKEPPTDPRKVTKYKRSLFRAYENLNEQVSEQTNNAIKDLFIIDMNTVSLNLVLFQ